MAMAMKKRMVTVHFHHPSDFLGEACTIIGKRGSILVCDGDCDENTEGDSSFSSSE